MTFAAAAFASVFAAAVIWAGISDARGLRIPNQVPILLAVAFVFYAILPGTGISLFPHVAVGIAAFSVCFALFLLRVIGGGDAKLIAVLGLWMGPDHMASFVFAFALIGGVFALALVALKRLLRVRPALAAGPPLPAAVTWAQRGILPYGIPIALAALLHVPALFLPAS